MDRLVRIKSIDSFRFFKNYRWNNALKPFGKTNLIYGWNGCGKSTLSDLFFSLETNSTLPPQCAFHLCFQEDGNPESIVTTRNISTIARRFKVYHQQYVQGLISNLDNVKHISIIGHDQGKAIAQINTLKKEKITWEGILLTITSEESATAKDFENYRKERATLVRSITRYNQSYNYNKIYERYQQTKNPIALSQEEYDRLSISVKATPKSRIDAPKIQLITKEICNIVLEALNASPVFSIIEKLQNNTALRDWVQRGYEIHKENAVEVCEFCNNPIQPQRWNELEQYFNDSLATFKNTINEVLQQLENCKSQYEKYQSQLPHDTQFFDEFSVEYAALRERATAFCKAYSTFISKAIELINLKSDKIIDTQCASDFEAQLTMIDFDNSIITEINTLIDKHNRKADDFAKSIADDEKRLELHIVAESTPQFADFETRLAENKKKKDEAQGKITAIVNEIIELDNKVKNSRIPAETINADISFIFGHSDLHFEWKENGYEIRRNDEIASFLSTGEQNAIALIYFFNSLQDSELSKDNCIVILDDPISSFDSNYYYSAAAYIREKLHAIGQVFILTHKFTLYKDFSRMFADCHRYLLERENNNPVLKEEDIFLRDYQDEYVYLFCKIYQFVKQPPDDFSDYLSYPNMGRRLLEGFVSFKLPEKYTQQRDILTKAIQMDGDGNTARVRAITRLVQNQSHLRLIGAHDSVENILDIRQLPNIFQHLLDFIQAHDPTHFETIKRQIDPEGLMDTQEPEAPIEEREIPLYDLPVSAGFGNRMDTYEPSEPYLTTNWDADFALKIAGDSMDPLYCDGDIVLVKKRNTIENAQIGIVAIDDEVFCKKIILTEDLPLIVSLNHNYPPRKIVEGERVDILGIVIDVETSKTE